ncbi:MAG TPA: selenocysteine-specific translation elongation factor, partial [Solirubrobacteraceae bacterium]|nr:selenocysteine-specific translation elongation factor [Solirubrobacteraceae bacterium]
FRPTPQPSPLQGEGAAEYPPSPLQGEGGFVIGTAGHIDHGKSTLITALTGIDPDRLAEEKRRGMTIDLGFAHMRLPSGREIGIVDVPGHARFIRNMLAGTHGLDAVLLVVAADEGVMPQTREHLEIVDLLDVRRGIVVLSKVDLVEPDWLELVKGEVTTALEGTSLEHAPQVGVSAVTGEGLDTLSGALDGLLSEAETRADLGRPRLPVDRVFTMSGFGTVVTGTLVDGTLEVGEELEVVPTGRRVRIRGLQRHNQKVESASPGNRVAANLIGVEKADLARGDVLVRPGTLKATRRVDANVRVLASSPQPLRHGAELLLHTGTAEVSCRVIMLEGDAIEPGGRGWVQLYLERAIAAAPHDRFILRLPSPPTTLAGGTFIDVDPRKHSRHDSAVRESLDRRAAGDVLQEELRKYPRGVTVAALLKATMAPQADVKGLRARRLGDWLYSDEAWSAIAQRATHELEAFHAAHPLRPGMAREELRSRLGVSPASFASVVQGLVQDRKLVESNSSIASPDHHVAADTAAGPARDLLDLLGQDPFAPPSLHEAMERTRASTEIVRSLAQRGEIVRVSDDIAFTKHAYDQAVTMVRELIDGGGSVTVAQLRDRMGASRRPVLALLEHLDAEHVTRRVGDARVLR